MSMYGIETHICGIPCAMVLRGSANGRYQAVSALDAGEEAQDVRSVRKSKRADIEVPAKIEGTEV